MSPDNDVFTVDDLNVLSDLAIETWRSGLDRDWSVRAGTLEWSCRKTAEHTVDTVFAPAFFLASRRQHAYPRFEDLHALPDASIADLIDGLRATTNILAAVIVTAHPEVRAITPATDRRDRYLCRRLFAHARRWPQESIECTDDSWSDLLASRGRPRPG